VEDLMELPPFAMQSEAKTDLYQPALSQLTRFHYEHSPEFHRVAKLLGYKPDTYYGVEDLPFIPVRLFKEFDLISADPSAIVKVLTSSGTSGQAVSRIHLDRITATNQTRVLVKIVSSFVGAKRLPLLIVDSPAVIKDRTLHSARGAAILGFSMLGCDPTYLLTEDHQIDFPRLQAFIHRHQGKQILLFGFTFIVWEHLCQSLMQSGRRLQLNGTLIHGGGWKKLAARAVDSATFKTVVADTCGISTICNYYGMVEQTGSIFMECSEGALHASIFSDVIVRDPLTFAALGPGRTGLLQLISLLPTSYPGHSILSEDLGEILGVDDCPCGRKGTYFLVHGRVNNAETRGCSDVYASH
jgi:phenylacetate-coenzyme A ligase PaaK-like adenylate-forming protein